MVDESGHGGTSETVLGLPYSVRSQVDGVLSGDPIAAMERRQAAADVANAELERRREAAEAEAQRKERERDEEARRFRPRGNYLLVKLKVTPKSAGGILLPDAKQEIPGHGVVMAVGPQVSYRLEGEPGQENYGAVLNISVGDELFFSRYVGATLEFPDGVADPRYRVMSEDEVYGSWAKKEAGVKS